MNAFTQLLNLPDEEKKARGAEHTPREIAQQPDTWRKAVEILRAQQQPVSEFMQRAGLRGEHRSTLILSGAGTSEFIGNAVCNTLRRGLQREVLSIPTTHLVTHAPHALLDAQSYTLLSFARSGNSPESLATYQMFKTVAPQAKHIFITCNKDGALAKAAQTDDDALCILLPEETNDRSLAMTSSFSTMAFAAVGLCFIDALDELAALAERLGAGAHRVMREYGDTLHEFAALPFTRASFLGADVLYGTMQECHLKMQEMTEGQVACRFDSFLGLRHGPQVFVNRDCVVVGALCSEPYARRYELDMLRELKAKGQGAGTLLICDRAFDELRRITNYIVELYPDSEPVADAYRIMTDVVAGQILATFKSLDIGLKPDNPSTSGTINRVVQGVRIYPYPPSPETAS